MFFCPTPQTFVGDCMNSSIDVTFFFLKKKIRVLVCWFLAQWSEMLVEENWQRDTRWEVPKKENFWSALVTCLGNLKCSEIGKWSVLKRHCQKGWLGSNSNLGTMPISHCQNDCVRFANLVLHQTKNLILCQTDLTLRLPAMTFYLARFILHLACWISYHINLFNNNGTDSEPDFCVWYNVHGPKHCIRCKNLMQSQLCWY